MVYGTKGRGFESLRTHQEKKREQRALVFFIKGRKVEEGFERSVKKVAPMGKFFRTRRESSRMRAERRLRTHQEKKREQRALVFFIRGRKVEEGFERSVKKVGPGERARVCERSEHSGRTRTFWE